MGFKNFSFTNVNVIFGIIEMEGFGTGNDVVQVVMDDDQYKKIVGAKGDVTRVQTNDNSCTITMKLLQTSASNKALNTQYLLDREAGLGTLPLIIQDKELGETVVVNNAWIMKMPDIVRGKDVNEMVWTLQGDFATTTII